MKLINKDIGISINIEDDLLDSLIIYGKRFYPKEFGGFLVGYYSDDFKDLYITDTILPKKYESTKYSFEREIIGLENIFKSFYSETPKKYYVGEWHTHPENLPIPSSIDIKAIKDITNHDRVSIKNPVLLIIGFNQQKVKLGFYVMFNEKLYIYDTI